MERLPVLLSTRPLRMGQWPCVRSHGGEYWLYGNRLAETLEPDRACITGQFEIAATNLAAGALVDHSRALVVDVGTAMTVDAAADGAFLGGSIGAGGSSRRQAAASTPRTARLPAAGRRRASPRPRASGGV